MTTDAKRARNRAYYQANRERILARRADYEADNKEQVQAYKKKYSKENRERFRVNQQRWRTKNPVADLVRIARGRARRNGIEFNISVEDLPLPEVCPLLGIHILPQHENLDCRPSIDRIDSRKGYVKGNVMIVSCRANRIKSNATAAELRQIADNLERIENGK